MMSFHGTYTTCTYTLIALITFVNPPQKYRLRPQWGPMQLQIVRVGEPHLFPYK